MKEVNEDWRARITKKLFVFDLDGTLLDSNKEVLESTHDILKEIKVAGHEVAIATGRSADMAKKAIDDSQIDHYVVCNGSAGFINHEPAFIHPLDRSELKELLNIAWEHNHPVVYETPQALRRHDEVVNPRVSGGMAFVQQPVPPIDSSYYEQEDLVQLLLFINEEEQAKYYDGKFEKLELIRWYEAGIDVIPAQSGKWQGVVEIANQLDVKQEDIIVFGDGNNDMDMISKAHTSVAMGNAHDWVKEAATYVAKTNDEDGIAEVIIQNNLI